MTPNFVFIAAVLTALFAARARRVTLGEDHQISHDEPEGSSVRVEQFHSPERRRLIVSAPSFDSWPYLERLARALAVDHRVHVVLVRSGPASVLYAADARGWSGEDDVVWGRWLDGQGELVRYADLRAADSSSSDTARDEES